MEAIIYAKNSDAKYLVFVEGRNSPYLATPDTPDEQITIESASRDLRMTVTRIEERQKYYWLPIDCYNQPIGYVEQIELFPTDYKNLKKSKQFPFYWLFDNESDAQARAID